MDTEEFRALELLFTLSEANWKIPTEIATEIQDSRRQGVESADNIFRPPDNTGIISDERLITAILARFETYENAGYVKKRWRGQPPGLEGKSTFEYKLTVIGRRHRQSLPTPI